MECLQLDSTYLSRFFGDSIHNAQLKISLKTLTWNNFINWNFLCEPFSTSLAANALQDLPGCCTPGLRPKPNLTGLGLVELQGGAVPDPVSRFDST